MYRTHKRMTLYYAYKIRGTNTLRSSLYTLLKRYAYPHKEKKIHNHFLKVEDKFNQIRIPAHLWLPKDMLRTLKRHVKETYSPMHKIRYDIITHSPHLLGKISDFAEIPMLYIDKLSRNFYELQSHCYDNIRMCNKELIDRLLLDTPFEDMNFEEIEKYLRVLHIPNWEKFLEASKAVGIQVKPWDALEGV